MKCPICNIPLLLADKQGIEIDYCPQCRGIWLDRGELEKIIEKSAQQEKSYPPDRHYEKHQDDHYYGDDNRNKRKRGLLGEMFDF